MQSELSIVHPIIIWPENDRCGGTIKAIAPYAYTEGAHVIVCKCARTVCNGTIAREIQNLLSH